MTTVLANRATRRRGIVFTILLAVTLFLMAFSSNPAVLEVQRGLSFAFQPALRGLDDFASAVASIATAIGEIDDLRTDNAALRSDNERLENENARLEQSRRENESLTALLQLRNGLEHKTVAARVIARESLEARRLIVIDRGEDDGVALGDVGDRGRAARWRVGSPRSDRTSRRSRSSATRPRRSSASCRCRGRAARSWASSATA